MNRIYYFCDFLEEKGRGFKSVEITNEDNKYYYFSIGGLWRLCKDKYLAEQQCGFNDIWIEPRIVNPLFFKNKEEMDECKKIHIEKYKKRN
jgi:hypothetical protein